MNIIILLISLLCTHINTTHAYTGYVVQVGRIESGPVDYYSSESVATETKEGYTGG